MARKLILGSSSPYRRELMERLHLDFETFKPEIDEHALPGETPQALVQRLAEAKAKKVSYTMANAIDALIIGSDQVAVCNGEILGKPHTKERAITQLLSFVGRKVTFYTGLSLYDAGADKAQTVCEPFYVTFRTDLTEAEITRYVELEQPLNCAGSFKSEGLGTALFAELSGKDPNSLIGLPTIKLLELLRNVGVNPLA
ncbi:septum formation protein Maf [Idiomarina sp. MD25a]|uniref:Maf family protein n=1 Tax=Idiomarina sp. MD25a TaxID=1889913 RepID=UPI0008F8AB2B|nr:nucleoside triphosphate pyrophosphatase [Idiomarina sp. MD25a]OIN02101.1 septum formation protein Maf [Idiomarina sp. MD25a]